ncbi:MAG TPA: hypothetical protein VNZ26_01560 [Vicinamibacterales bacterium]|nr:hypothetical protein [Vicinamibacterales bacterium]
MAPARDSLSLRLDRDLHDQLKAYATFLGGASKDYIISWALKHVFRRDKEFRAWLEARGDVPIVEAPNNGNNGVVHRDEDLDSSLTEAHSTRLRH